MSGVWDEMRAESIAEGMAQGVAQGMAQGMAQGVAQGMAQGKVEVARRMLAANMSYEQVAEFTALPIEEIRVLN